jgi:HAMP domain-containing protein
MNTEQSETSTNVNELEQLNQSPPFLFMNNEQSEMSTNVNELEQLNQSDYKQLCNAQAEL